VAQPETPCHESPKLAAPQARTDETVKQLAADLQKLAAARARTDEAVQRLTEAMHELRREVGALAHNVGFGLEELGGIVLPGVLDRDHGVP
jgi:chromosome segregation ATPase